MQATPGLFARTTTELMLWHNGAIKTGLCQIDIASGRYAVCENVSGILKILPRCAVSHAQHRNPARFRARRNRPQPAKTSIMHGSVWVFELLAGK